MVLANVMSGQNLIPLVGARSRKLLMLCLTLKYVLMVKNNFIVMAISLRSQGVAEAVEYTSLLLRAFYMNTYGS